MNDVSYLDRELLVKSSNMVQGTVRSLNFVNQYLNLKLVD